MWDISWMQWNKSRNQQVLQELYKYMGIDESMKKSREIETFLELMTTENITKSMEYNKSSTKREVYINK